MFRGRRGKKMKFVLGECVGEQKEKGIFLCEVLLWPPIPRTKPVPKFWHPSITRISVHLHVGELKASILTESSPLLSKTDFFQMDKKRVSAKNYKISPKQSVQKIRRGGAGQGGAGRGRAGRAGPRSIGHPPHSSASPVELRLRVGPRAHSGKKKNLGNGG